MAQMTTESIRGCDTKPPYARPISGRKLELFFSRCSWEKALATIRADICGLLSRLPSLPLYLPIYRREHFLPGGKEREGGRGEIENARRRVEECPPPLHHRPLVNPVVKQQPSASTLLPLSRMLALQTTSFQTIFLICTRCLRNPPVCPHADVYLRPAKRGNRREMQE